MNKLPLIFSIAALALAAIAFYESRSLKPVPAATVAKNQAGGNTSRIAYFEMDSIESNYQYVKDGYAQVKSKEASINNELAALGRSYQNKMNEWQQKGAQMTQAETQQAQKEYGQMQQTYQQRQNALEQELTDMRNKKLRDIQVKIEEYLKEYNKEKGYAYIFSYEPALFIYYKDPACNITAELLKGLNEAYAEDRKKK